MDPIPQSGFLFKLEPTDFILGASPLQWDIVMPSGDWRNYVPSDEKQYNLTFDTMSCTTFSALNVIEHWVNYYIKNDKLSITQLEKLNQWGFIEDGKFNCSDRFTAIMSGTTPVGNYFQNVLNSIRETSGGAGLLPEKDFAFSGKTWAEYHDKTKITQAMLDKAKKIWEIFEFAYEWVPVTSTQEELAMALKQSPVQVAVNRETPTHAIMLPKMDWEFESYKPYLRPRNRTIAYAMKIKVQIKNPVQIYKYFKMEEKTDLEGKHTFSELDPSMRSLADRMRGECGFAWRITSGYRTKEENESTVGSVSDSAHVSKLAIDVYCVDSTKRDKIINVAKANGVKRIGIGKNFVHLDIDKSKPQEVMWHYY